MVQLFIHQRLELAFARGHFRRKPADHDTRLAHLIGVLDTQFLYSAARRLNHIIDHDTNLLARQFANQPARAHVGMASQYRLPTLRHKRQFKQLVNVEQARPNAIVNVMIVISNIIADRRNLRLKRWPVSEA